MGDIADNGTATFPVGPQRHEPWTPPLGGLAVHPTSTADGDRATRTEIYHVVASYKYVRYMAHGRWNDKPTTEVDIPRTWSDSPAETRFLPWL